MRGLHRGDHAQCGESRKFLWRHHLRMFDAPAMIGLRRIAQHARIGIHHQPVAAVADGVRRHLHAAAARLAHGRLQRRRFGHQQATVAGIVAVVLQQGGAPAAQRAVGIQLHAPHLQAAAGMAVQPAGTQVRQRRVVAIGIGVDAQGQPPLVGELLHQCQVLARYAHVVHAGESVAHGSLGGLLQRLPAVSGIGRRHHRMDERHGRIDEHAGRAAARSLDTAAIRLPLAVQRSRRLRRSRAQRRAVGPAGMAVHALQPHGAIGKGRIQVGGRGKRLLRPVVLVPAAAQQPRIGGQLLLVFAQPRDHVRLVARIHQVRAHQRVAQAHHMTVRIDQAGNDGLAGRFHAAGVGIPGAQVIGAADSENAPLRIPGDRLRDRVRRIGRVHALRRQHVDLRLRQARDNHASHTQSRQPRQTPHAALPNRSRARLCAMASRTATKEGPCGPSVAAFPCPATWCPHKRPGRCLLTPGGRPPGCGYGHRGDDRYGYGRCGCRIRRSRRIH